MIAEKDLWLGMVRPLLGGIRSNASWVQHHAKEILEKVELLPYAPDFETEAQAEIDAAIKMVTAASEILQKARITYLGKPIRK